MRQRCSGSSDTADGRIHRHRRHRRAAAVAAALACLLLSATAHAALVYKNYIVQQDGGTDILCAPYTVQPGDWVIKILKLRGEIAAQDFPYFLQIFARINPHVKDVDRIRPGQQIFIPLRELPSGSREARDGLVTIPFVDLSSRSGSARTAPTAYRVQSGDTISKLVASRYGRYGSNAYKEGIRQLKQLNPRIKDLDLIFVDQVVFLPSPGAPGAPPARTEPLASAPVTARPISRPPPPAAASRDPGHGFGMGNAADQSSRPTADISTLSEAAAMMSATIRNTGSQVFPGGSRGAVRIDFARTPVIDLPDGRKVMLTADRRPIEAADLAAVEKQWKDFRQLSLPSTASLEEVLEAVLDSPEKGERPRRTVQVTAGGVTFEVRPKWLLDGPGASINPIRHICITPIDAPSQRTPTGIIRFLAQHGVRIREVMRPGRAGAVPPPAPPKRERATSARETVVTVTTNDHRRFVEELVNAMGYDFTRNVAISFPYAGIEVKAMSNLVTTRSGNPLFIDFGDLFGDAFEAITNTGFNIIQVTAQDDTRAIIDKLTRALDEPVANQPAFLAAQRPARYNTRIGIPGSLLGHADGDRTLITAARIADPVKTLLHRKRVAIVMVQAPAAETPASEPSRQAGKQRS